MVSSRSRPSSSSRPCCGRRRPATRRSKEDLPTPLGPVTSSASPAPTVKLKARKACRPPLTQARSDPTSRITCRPPARVVAEAIIPAAIQPPSDLHWPRLWSGQGAEKSLILCPCRWQASIFWNGAKKDPISHRPAPTINARWTRDPGTGEAIPVVSYRRVAPSPDWMGTDHDDVTLQFSLLQAPQGGQQDLRLLQPADRGEERPQEYLAAAVLHEGAAGESAAQRGWPLDHQGGHPGGRAVAQNQDVRTRDRLSPGARVDAGLHRRAGGRRSRRHARRHEDARRRPEEDQSARSRRSRLRSLGGGHVLRHQQRGQEEC